MLGHDAQDNVQQKTKKKKKDKNRVTDLEEFDLEGEEPDTTEARLKKNASKKIGNVVGGVQVRESSRLIARKAPGFFNP
jgi:hypothetical protein